MIFTEAHADMNIKRTKSQTRRVKKEGDVPWYNDGRCKKVAYVRRANGTLKYCVGNTYANQTGRGEPANGRIRLLAIREERLQDISSADMTAEGYPIFTLLAYPLSVRLRGQQSRFVEAWDSIVPRKDRWEKNRPVWVLVYEYVQDSEAK